MPYSRADKRGIEAGKAYPFYARGPQKALVGSARWKGKPSRPWSKKRVETSTDLYSWRITRQVHLNTGMLRNGSQFANDAFR